MTIRPTVCATRPEVAPGETWTRLFVWMAIGVVIYFTYGFKRSRLAGADQVSRPLAAS